MSSAIQPATSFQPAACHVSNGPCPSRSPSGSRGRRRARCPRCSRGGTRRSGTRRGTSPTGTAPADAARAELGELLAGVADLEDLRDLGRDLARGRPIVGLRRVEHLDLASLLAVEARPGLLAERALGDQCGHHLRHAEVRVPGIVLPACRASCRSRARWCRGRPRRRCGTTRSSGGRSPDRSARRRRRSRRPKRSVCSIVATIENTPMRLAMKFGVSLARTTPLPSVVTRNASRSSSRRGSVAGPAMSSTRCM